MAYTTVPSVVTGQTYSAANYNTYVKDNINALWVYTTAGDIVYAASATTIARLGLTVGGVLIGGAIAPEWLALGTAYQLLRVNAGATAPEWGIMPFVVGTKINSVDHQYNSQTIRNMPNSDVSVTLAVRSTILVFGGVNGYCDAVNCFAEFWVNIDGSESIFTTTLYNHTIGALTVPIWGIKANVAAGARTIVLRERQNYGNTVNYTVVEKGYMVAAIPD
jgi:hypothetical protein